MSLSNIYFDWLCEMVKCDDHYELLHLLHQTEFVCDMDMDNNRLLDGIDLRYRFGRSKHLSKEVIDSKFDRSTCSILEVMIALAIRMEETIFDDPQLGDRTYKWFWGMIDSLGLIDMTDDNYDYDIAIEVIENFLNRYYDSDGNGGLFYVPDSCDDMRGMEIWSQMCVYTDMLLGL